MLQDRRAAEIPNAILNQSIKIWFFAAAVAIFSVVLAICFMNMKLIAGLLISLYFVYYGYNILLCWREGNIIPIEAICFSISNGLVKDSMTVKFIDWEQDGIIYTFKLPKSKTLKQGMRYTIYLNKDNPNVLVAYAESMPLDSQSYS